VIKVAVTAHRTGHFSVPRAVLHQLGIGQDEPIHLVVDGDAFHWEGTVKMASGEEIYPHADQPHTHGLNGIRPYQRLILDASRP
jgi:hypothetical protein